MNNEIEARPFEEYKEMIKSMSKEEMIKGLYDLSKSCIEKDNELERLRKITKQDECDYYVEGLEGLIKEKDREIERLNNILNELEKYCETRLNIFEQMTDEQREEQLDKYKIYDIFLSRIEKLKGDSSNDK